jgi:hypothetical protein
LVRNEVYRVAVEGERRDVARWPIWLWTVGVGVSGVGKAEGRGRDGPSVPQDNAGVVAVARRVRVVSFIAVQ